MASNNIPRLKVELLNPLRSMISTPFRGLDLASDYL